MGVSVVQHFFFYNQSQTSDHVTVQSHRNQESTEEIRGKKRITDKLQVCTAAEDKIDNKTLVFNMGFTAPRGSSTC